MSRGWACSGVAPAGITSTCSSQVIRSTRRCSSGGTRVADPSGAKLSFISAEDLCLHELLFGRAKDLVDLEHVFARHPDLDVAYLRHWLEPMTPDGDARRRQLDDLEQRFLRRS